MVMLALGAWIGLAILACFDITPSRWSLFWTSVVMALALFDLEQRTKEK